MPGLLLVAHCPSEKTTALRDALLRGAEHPDIDDVEVRLRAPLEADASDVLWCDGIVIATTENFGAMAGRTKDFFERIYYPCLEETQGMPAALCIRAGEDGSGTQQGIERIFAGLRWKAIQPPLVLRGKWQDGFLAEAEELGMTMAAGLSAGIF